MELPENPSNVEVILLFILSFSLFLNLITMWVFGFSWKGLIFCRCIHFIYICMYVYIYIYITFVTDGDGEVCFWLWKNGGTAAVAREAGEPLVIEEVIVDTPKAHEVRVKIICTSLCLSDVTFWRLKVSLYCYLYSFFLAFILMGEKKRKKIESLFFEGTSWLLSKNPWSWSCWVIF